MAKKLNLAKIAVESGSNYPAPFDAPCATASWQRLGRTSGLAAFGVNLERLPPGAWSSQRHWHTHEDEFLMVVQGEVTLVTDAGEECLTPGDCAAFPAGDPDGHHLINRSAHDTLILVIGNADNARDRCFYSDIDMVAEPGGGYTHRDGTPYQ